MMQIAVTDIVCMQNTGYVNSLAQPNISITIFAPVNAAFSAPVLKVRYSTWGSEGPFQANKDRQFIVMHERHL